MKVRIKYERNSHQQEFHDDTQSKILHLSCGYGGGKSYSLVMKALQLSWLNRGFPGGLVVPSIADYKKDLEPIFEEILDTRRIKYRYHQSNKWFEFPWSDKRLYLASCEKRIKGPNWAYALINEVTLIGLESFNDVLGRVRIKGAPCPQIAMSGTPEGTHHWLYEKLVETPMANSRVIFGNSKDNQQNLSDDYFATMESSYDAIMQDAYIKGLFVNMQGRRFYYGYDPMRHDNKTLERLDGVDVRVSLDYNVSPMCATLWHIIPARSPNGMLIYDFNRQPLRKAIAFNQIEIADNADTHQMCDAMIAQDLDPQTTYIYPDPAGNARSTKGPPDNEILKQRGFKNVKVKLVAPQFRKRQLAVNNLFDKNLIELNPLTCKGLKKDLMGVEQNPATYEKIKTNPKLTHYSDGLDYFVDLEFPLSGSRPPTQSFKIR